MQDGREVRLSNPPAPPPFTDVDKLITVCDNQPAQFAGRLIRMSWFRTNPILRLAWDRWLIIGHINGTYISRFVANAFYVTILVPFALGARLLIDPLKLKRPVAWLDRAPVPTTLDDARNQF